MILQRFSIRLMPFAPAGFITEGCLKQKREHRAVPRTGSSATRKNGNLAQIFKLVLVHIKEFFSGWIPAWITRQTWQMWMGDSTRNHHLWIMEAFVVYRISLQDKINSIMYFAVKWKTISWYRSEMLMMWRGGEVGRFSPAARDGVSGL